MSEAKFTKGPWKRNYHANGCQYVSAQNGMNGCYSVASTHGPDDLANAHLIAAAPDMYEILIQLQIGGGLGIARHRQIDKILAKARGESQ